MTNQLSLYGNRDDILALSQRLQSTLPGGRKLKTEEALSLAQLALAHGLDPFNGDVWYIPGSGLMVGIKGLRKAAKRAAQAEGGNYWTEKIPVEPNKYDAPENAVVYECILRDTITAQAWAKSVSMLRDAEVPYKDVLSQLGESPKVVGIGIATPDEPSKMPIHQRARKRAEADAIKQRFDVALEAEYSDTEVIEAEFIPAQGNGSEPPQEDEPEIYFPSDDAVADTSFTPAQADEPITGERPYNPEALKERLEMIANLPNYRNYVVSIHQRQLLRYALDLCFAGNDASDDMRHSTLLWLTGESSTTDIPGSLVKAMLDKWLEPEKDANTGDYSINPTAAQEANTVYTQALADEGQVALL